MHTRTRVFSLSSILTFAGLLGCARLPTVVPLAEAEAGEYAYYSLPRTVIVVSTKGTVTTVNPKPKCLARDDLREQLGLERAKVGGSVFSIAELSITTRVEADPDQIYAVELRRSGTNAVALESNARGLPSAASASSTDAVAPALTAGIGLVASLIGKVAFGAPEIAPSPTGEDPCDAAASMVEDLREARTALYRTEGAADGKDVLEYKAATLDVAIKTLEGWFTGVELGKPKSIVCELRPIPGTTEYPLFRYSKAAGIDRQQPHSCDLAAEFVATGTGTDPELARVHALTLSVVPTTTTLASTLAVHLPEPTAAKRSFYYRVPGYARVAVLDTVSPERGGQADQAPRRLTAETEWPVAQLGLELSLPRLSAGGSIELAVGFDPDTGALIELSSKRQAADLSGQLSGLSASAGGLVEAAQAKADPLKQLQATQAILEARVAIDAAEQALESAIE